MQSTGINIYSHAIDSLNRSFYNKIVITMQRLYKDVDMDVSFRFLINSFRSSIQALDSTLIVNIICRVQRLDNSPAECRF